MSEPSRVVKVSYCGLGPWRNFLQELRLLARIAVKVRSMVPRRYQFALGTAAVVMVLTSLVATSLPILLGRLVDHVQRGNQEGMSGSNMFRAVCFYLACIAGVVLLPRGAQSRPSIPRRIDLHADRQVHGRPCRLAPHASRSVAFDAREARQPARADFPQRRWLHACCVWLSSIFSRRRLLGCSRWSPRRRRSRGSDW